MCYNMHISKILKAGVQSEAIYIRQKLCTGFLLSHDVDFFPNIPNYLKIFFSQKLNLG